MPMTDTPSCDLVLYTHPWSLGQIARWMLEETGAPYRQVVTECAAICAYLADAFPAAGLAPAPAQRAAYYRWLFFAAGPLEASVVDRTLGVKIEEKQERMVGYGNYDKVMDTLAGTLARTTWLGGAAFSAADLYVGAQLIWGMQFGTIAKRAEFEDYAARLTQRPAYLAAKAIDMSLGTQLAQKQA